MENRYYHLREIKNIISPPSRGLNGGLMVYFLIQRLTVYPFETRHAVYPKKNIYASSLKPIFEWNNTIRGHLGHNVRYENNNNNNNNLQLNF